jgi:hypothetical protein
MAVMHATEETEAGVLPSEQLLSEMSAFNEELVNAGVMLAGEGLKRSAEGKRVTLTKDDTSVVDGPFAETKELIAGFWILQVKSMDEALEWIKRVPKPHTGEAVIEIRPVFEAEDFGDELTPELRAQEEALRERAAKNA